MKIEAAPLRKHLPRVRERARAFFENFPEREGRFPFGLAERKSFLEHNHEAFEDLSAAVKRIETELSALNPKPEEVITLARRAAELRREFEFLLESEEKSYVYWYERRGKGIMLTATPIDVSEILREKLFEQFDTVVLTSATLAVGGRFDFLKQRLGVMPAKETSPAAGIRFSRTGAALYSGVHAGRAARNIFHSRGARNREAAGNLQGPRVLPFHQLRANAGGA